MISANGGTTRSSGGRRALAAIAVALVVVLFPQARSLFEERFGGNQPEPVQLPDSAELPESSERIESAQASLPLKHGILRDLGEDRFLSPAGLLYAPGSAEGHRLEHLRRHVEDIPERAGPHGVFDGGMTGALATIDRAYERAQAGIATSESSDQGRIIYTVEMDDSVGYVGGREGARRRHPPARRVRMVLEGNRLITAYPM